jgi:hypothetical protein
LILAGEPASKPEAARTVALETFAHRSLNYLNRMVDTNGLPYFNIFWTDPAEAGTYARLVLRAAGGVPECTGSGGCSGQARGFEL